MKNDIVHINKPKFDTAKENIKEKLDEISNTIQLENFRTEGTIIPTNNHNVTGAEINDNLVVPLQKLLIEQNNNVKNIYQTLTDVYKAFDELDNEYIHGILTAVKSAEMASGQALNAANKADTAQKDVNKTIDALLFTVENLKKFKEQVTKDLSDISTLSNEISSLKLKILKYENKNNSIEQSILGDVANHKKQLSIHDKLLEDVIDDTTKKTDAAKKEISEMAIAQKEINEQLSKKIKIAYRIAGCAMAFSIGQFVLQWFGVL